MEELFKGRLPDLISLLEEEEPSSILKSPGIFHIWLAPFLTTGCPACTFDNDVMRVFVEDVQSIVSRFGSLMILVSFPLEKKTLVPITVEMMDLDWDAVAEMAGASDACQILPVIDGLTWIKM